MKNKIYSLIKIYKEEKYADAFLNEGAMYFQLLSEFKKIEDGFLRGDPHEGVIAWHQPDQVKITISYDDADLNKISHTIDSKNITAPITISNNGLGDLNIFCMYAFCIDADVKFPYDDEDEDQKNNAKQQLLVYLNSQVERISAASELGGHAVLVYDVNRFVKQVDSALMDSSSFYNRRLVDYFDPKSFNGFFDFHEAPFKKRDIYAKQSEFRFAFKSESDVEPKLLRIGSIKDYAKKIKIEEISKMFSFEFDE